jgi:DNA-binding CsgD family transcriptional regulator
MKTTNNLQCLFQEIAHARDEQEIRQHVMVKVGEYFAAKRWGLFFMEELPPANRLRGLAKLAVSIDYNPVLRYMVENHAPVHEEILLPPGMWKTICPRSDHGHVMAGPIVSNGLLVGGVALTRFSGDPAFDARNLTDLSALSLHLSTWLTKMRSPNLFFGEWQPAQFNSLNINRLTPREMEIANLVAQGLTNAEIGAKLWITENSVKQALKRMFRKLEISSRAELVGKLFSEGIYK